MLKQRITNTKIGFNLCTKLNNFKYQTMRNLIYIFFLIVSSNIFAQSSIEQDELFLKYEQEYLNSSRAQLGVNYEKAINNFYSKFIDFKSRYKFEKAKDKERWLS